MTIDVGSVLERDGFVVMPQLLGDELTLPVLTALDELLDAAIPQAFDGACVGDEEALHSKLRRAAELDRRTLARVYDTIRKTAAFWRLIGSVELQAAASSLLGPKGLAVAFRGAGIRLDLPNEDRWRSDWHQEYHAQLTSLRGVVAWFPFADVSSDMGPVQIARGSQTVGLLPASCPDPCNTKQDYTQAITIPDAAATAERFPIVAPEVRRGDVVFIDFLTLHASGFNRSARTRITGQVRFVDLLHPSSIRIGWQGGMHEGGSFAQFHPDLVL